jgi:hypothetical protein
MDKTNVALLISGYLDNELSADEAARLASMLERDDRSLDRLVSSSFIHSQLLDWMNQPHVNADAIAAAISANGAASDSIDWRAGSSPTPANSVRRPLRVLSWSAVAAALLVAASLSIVAYVVGSRPVYVGQLTDATDCRWAAAQAEIPMGTLLEGGQELALDRGRAVITFASGTKLLLEAPTKLRLISPMQVDVREGQIAAKVPRQAIGFTVANSLANFVDLGTAFTLDVVADKSFKLHVHEGLVEVQLDRRFGQAARRPTRVAAVRALSFNVKSGDVENLHFQEGKQMPF